MVSSYLEFSLVGGPKDGHVVKVARRNDGGFKTTLHRSYKVRGGRAWYGFNIETECYEYERTEPEYPVWLPDFNKTRCEAFLEWQKTSAK